MRRRVRPRARHLAVAPAVLGGVVRLQDPGLRLVGLREGVPALLAHALHLPDLADGLLELLHAVGGGGEMSVHLFEDRAGKEREGEGRVSEDVKHTVACSPECCTSGSPGCGGTSGGSTSS